MTQREPTSSMEDKKSKIQVAFAALDPYLEISLPVPTQKEMAGCRYIPYGRDNLYPQFLLSMYEECSTLKAIIDGNVNYVLGNDIQFSYDIDKSAIKEALTECVRDYYIFGYSFLQIIRNALGELAEVLHLPAECVRCDKEHQAFWYSEKWKGYGKGKAVVYPAFIKDGRQPSSVFMIGKGRNTYPLPLWSAAVRDVVIEQKIEEFHLNELRNNFLSSCIVNFNNGTPSDKEKAEIERNMQEKFSGTDNAGRMMLCFNENVQNRTTVDRLASDNFDTRYQALAQRTREQIFIAFKAQPLLFGLTSESNTGFSTQEFSDLFRLYSKTMISPVQDMLVRAMNFIYDSEVFAIKPFTL